MSYIIQVLEYAEIFINVQSAVLRGEMSRECADELLTDFWTHAEEARQ